MSHLKRESTKAYHTPNTTKPTRPEKHLRIMWNASRHIHEELASLDRVDREDWIGRLKMIRDDLDELITEAEANHVEAA